MRNWVNEYVNKWCLKEKKVSSRGLKQVQQNLSTIQGEDVEYDTARGGQLIWINMNVKNFFNVLTYFTEDWIL